jgi:hypothetical protein
MLKIEDIKIRRGRSHIQYYRLLGTLGMIFSISLHSDPRQWNSKLLATPENLKRLALKSFSLRASIGQSTTQRQPGRATSLRKIPSRTCMASSRETNNTLTLPSLRWTRTLITLITNARILSLMMPRQRQLPSDRESHIPLLSIFQRSTAMLSARR